MTQSSNITATNSATQNRTVPNSGFISAPGPHDALIAPAHSALPSEAGATFFPSDGDTVTERDDLRAAICDLVFYLSLILGVMFLADRQTSQVHDANGNLVLSHQLTNQSSLKSISGE